MSGLETRGLRRSHPGAGGERREVLRGVDLRLEPPVTRFDEDLQGEAPSA